MQPTSVRSILVHTVLNGGIDGPVYYGFDGRYKVHIFNHIGLLRVSSVLVENAYQLMCHRRLLRSFLFREQQALARRNQLFARSWSLGTPIPCAYISPNATYALGFSCVAAL